MILNEAVVAQRYNEYKTKQALQQKDDLLLQQNKTLLQNLTKKAVEKARKAEQLHPVTTQKNYLCACCNTHIKKGSKVNAKRSEAFFQYRGPNYFITLHYCQKCAPLEA